MAPDLSGTHAAPPGSQAAGQENPDPWKHRSAKMKCFSCIWFVRKEADTPTKIGRCRRHAPTMSGYPVVFETDWCGDHKLDENKT